MSRCRSIASRSGAGGADLWHVDHASTRSQNSWSLPLLVRPELPVRQLEAAGPAPISGSDVQVAGGEAVISGRAETSRPDFVYPVIAHLRNDPAARPGGAPRLDEQDRTRWDSALIAEGYALVRRCLEHNRPDRCQLLAAISAVHTDATRAADTDWRQILALYDQLLTRLDTPVVPLNRALATAEHPGERSYLRRLRRSLFSRPERG